MMPADAPHILAAPSTPVDRGRASDRRCPGPRTIRRSARWIVIAAEKGVVIDIVLAAITAVERADDVMLLAGVVSSDRTRPSFWRYHLTARTDVVGGEHDVGNAS